MNLSPEIKALQSVVVLALIEETGPVSPKNLIKAAASFEGRDYDREQIKLALWGLVDDQTLVLDSQSRVLLNSSSGKKIDAEKIVKPLQSKKVKKH